MAVSKATKKKAELLSSYKGYKDFKILKATQHLKKGQQVELTFEFYCIFKKQNLI
tara:strand:- start:579 stop:743 length:165 start_codon:yes stop_codon:yes gene_type:complete